MVASLRMLKPVQRYEQLLIFTQLRDSRSQ